MAALSAAQDSALRAIDEEGTYGRYKIDVPPRYSPNFYHPYHRPGNTIVDARTARVLVERGLAEVRYGRLFRTEAGTTLARTTRRKG